jgi:hypothetical protein
MSLADLRADFWNYIFSCGTVCAFVKKYLQGIIELATHDYWEKVSITKQLSFYI